MVQKYPNGVTRQICFTVSPLVAAYVAERRLEAAGSGFTFSASGWVNSTLEEAIRSTGFVPGGIVESESKDEEKMPFEEA